MPTVNQLIYNIRNTADAGLSQRAQRFSDRQLLHWVNAHRKRLIYEDYMKKRWIDPYAEQDLGCVQLTDADKADCVKYQWGENVKKAVIPDLVNLPVGGGLTFVGLLNKQTRIPIDILGSGQYAKYNLYRRNKSRLAAYIIGNKIYVEGIEDDTTLDIIDPVSGLCAINIRGIFADPAQAGCMDWDKDEYPLPAHLEEMLYQRIWSTELAVAANGIPDRKNDDNGDEKL
jgi:hypothetical protein